eukprot:8355834-Pyramimonas_sp.AAC.1
MGRQGGTHGDGMRCVSGHGKDGRGWDRNEGRMGMGRQGTKRREEGGYPVSSSCSSSSSSFPPDSPHPPHHPHRHLHGPAPPPPHPPFFPHHPQWPSVLDGVQRPQLAEVETAAQAVLRLQLPLGPLQGLR